MKQFMRTASLLSSGFFPLLLIAVLLPLLMLGLFGVIALVDYGYIFHFVGLLAVCALLISGLWWLRRRPQTTDPSLTQESLVSPSGDWSDYDLQVWQQLNLKISEQLQQDARWEELQDHALALITATADHYRNKGYRQELAFSIPELLLMVEEISRRYRRLLKQHVPFVEQTRLSLLVQAYDNKERLERGHRWAQRVWNSYRVVRFVNPVTAVMAELRSQVIGKMMSQVSEEFQLKLKQALLQEVISVAIDLYSGRFKGERNKLLPDKDKIAPAPDPLRICFVGQTGAGKSSIINALVESMVAEVSPLPSTATTRVYRCHIEGLEDVIHLVDLPGLDGNKQTTDHLLKEATNSDLLLWILKANQPARSLDVDFKQRLDNFYLDPAHRSFKRPAIIGVLNQVDRLPPATDWSPPYGLEHPQHSKASTIKEALEYNRSLLGVNQLIPLSVSESQPTYNLHELKTVIDTAYQQALQVQLNRRRVQAEDSVKIGDQMARLYQSGKSLFAMISNRESARRN